MVILLAWLLFDPLFSDVTNLNDLERLEKRALRFSFYLPSPLLLSSLSFTGSIYRTAKDE